jgi:hypothetical protein
MQKDFLNPNEPVYLGIPFREETLPIDEIRQSDIYNTTNINQSNNTSGFYRQIELMVFDPATAITTGDNKIQAVIPFDAILVGAYAQVDTPSTSGTVDVTLMDGWSEDILSGKIQIEVGEYSSHTASLQPDILTSKKLFARHDIIAVNIDSIGTGTKGLIITLYFVVIRYFDD